MTATAVTPVRRDVRFEISPAELDGWHAEGRSVTHFINAMSVFFPVGERFFIHAVRHYRDRISDPDLAKAVTGFIGQEALHGREHEVYNAALEALGYPAAEQEQRVIALLEFVKQRLPKSMQLSGTIALEHFTAMLADLVLKDERMMAGASPKLAALWRWHALEETEHKAVAFDVWQTVMGKGPVAYAERTLGLVLATVIFWSLVTPFFLRAVQAEGRLTDLEGWRGWANHTFGRIGFMRRLLRPWADYFRPNFHPWDHDNRHFLEQLAAIEQRYAEAA
jgi:uncharacterized protein